MLGKHKRETERLHQKIEELTQKFDDLQEKYGREVKVLRQQLAAVVSGIRPSVTSILRGLAYSEITKEEVVEFIAAVPNLLILDVRSDEGWNNGYIPGAKHIPANQVFQRLDELSDKSRPILTVCANGNTAVGICQLLTREGYQNVFNALGGMAGYGGDLVRPEIQASDITQVQGADRKLVAKVLAVIDRDVRPGLKRDGGDIQVVEVNAGVVKVKLVGACVGCGAQKRTVEDGIKNHLKKMIPEIHAVEDLTLGIPS